MGNFISRFSNLYILVLFAGFPFVSLLPALASQPEGSFSVIYRIIVLVWSGAIILSYYFSFSYRNLNKYVLLYIFLFLYSCRFLFDLYFQQIKLYSDMDSSDYIQQFVGIVLIPTLAISYLNYRKINLKWILRWSFRSIFIILLVAAFIRIGSNVVGRSAGDLQIGVLLYGQFGTSLCLLSIYFLMNERIEKSSWIYVASFILGFVTIFISSSKSPFVALMFSILLFTYLKYGGLKTLFASILVAVLLFFSFFDIMDALNSYLNSPFLERILFSLENGDQARAGLANEGIRSAIDNPIFGRSILLQDGIYVGSYPHNLIIEALMALGFLGGFIFIAWIVKCFQVFRWSVKMKHDVAWIGLLFCQYFMFGMFSGNLYSSNLFWYFSVFLIGFYDSKSTKGVFNKKN